MKLSLQAGITIVVIVCGLAMLGFLVGLFIDPAKTCVLAGGALCIAAGMELVRRAILDHRAPVVIKVDDAKLVVRLDNSPFDKKGTDALLQGAADYLLRGLRSGQLPQLAEQVGPVVQLASPVQQPTEQTSKQPEPPASAEKHLDQPEPAPATVPAPQRKPEATSAPRPQTSPQDEQDCEICMAVPATRTTDVWDGQGLISAHACQACHEESEAQVAERGYPKLLKRGEGGALVSHVKAPTLTVQGGS